MAPLLVTLLLFLAASVLAPSAFAGEWHAVASTDKAWRPTGAQLTLAETLRLAEAEAARNHVIFSDFLAPSFEYSHDETLGYTWIFIYDAKIPAPGAHFGVIVNDRTRKARFMPGE